VVGSVVASATVAPVVVEAIVATTPIVVDPVVPTPAVVVDSIAPLVMFDLMRTLLVIGRVIAAAACLRDSGHRNRTGRDQRSEGSCVSMGHIPIPFIGDCHCPYHAADLQVQVSIGLWSGERDNVSASGGRRTSATGNPRANPANASGQAAFHDGTTPGIVAHLHGSRR
jgi:hypothetical protein